MNIVFPYTTRQFNMRNFLKNLFYKLEFCLNFTRSKYSPDKIFITWQK